jgi:heme-degrading monooxygenase HmoA
VQNAGNYKINPKKEDNMAIDVMIKRRVKPGRQAKELVPTLSNLEYPDECLVVSRWESIDDWNRWRQSRQRTAIEQKIEMLTGEKTEYNIYAPMVADTDQGQAFIKKFGQLNNNG